MSAALLTLRELRRLDAGSISTIPPDLLLELCRIDAGLPAPQSPTTVEPAHRPEGFLNWCIEALAPEGWSPAAHHRLLIQHLEAVARGEIERLMVFMPPGSAKSKYTSVLFPAWLLSTRSALSIIGASHTGKLAMRFSGFVQRLIRDNRDALGYGLRTEARERWETTNDGEYLAAGVGGAIPGFRADVAIIDDPIKGREAADSEANREKVWEWYTGDLTPRMKPDGRIILMHTRWHEDDLAGRLLAAERAEWTVLNVPAQAEDEDDPLGRRVGEYLWADDNYGFAAKIAADHRRYERTGALREWSSQYQQRPRPTDGALFKTSLVTALDAAPAVVAQVRAWDLAATAKTGTRDPDWTVGLKLGRLADNRYVVLDVVRTRGDPADIEALILATASRDGKGVPISLPQDPGQAGKTQVRYLAGKLAGYTVHVSTETGSKETRASPVASQCNVGNLLIVRGPRGADWNPAFLDELAAFPAGAKDDQVDALSRAFERLALAPKVPIVGAIVAMTPRVMTP